MSNKIYFGQVDEMEAGVKCSGGPEFFVQIFPAKDPIDALKKFKAIYKKQIGYSTAEWKESINEEFITVEEFKPSSKKFLQISEEGIRWNEI